VVTVEPIKGGWAARGNGWAVHGKTREEAICLYQIAERKHREIESRPLPKPAHVPYRFEP
jgi:hypothetical protein